MLRVRFDDYAADGAAHLDKAPTAEHDATGAQLSGKPRLVGELHFDQVVAILRRRSPLILTIAGIGTVLAIIVGLLIPPKYTAMAQLVIEAPAGSAAERAPGVSVMDESIDTHVTLLGSRDHLQRVIESLSQDPEFRPAARNTADPEPTLGGSGAQESAAVDQPTDSTATEATGLTELKRRLNVWLGAFRGRGSTAVPPLEEFERNTRAIQERRSRVISVGFTSTSPEKAAAFANRIVQLYVDRLTQQKQAYASREVARLDERIAETKYENERAVAAVQNEIQQKHDSEQNASSGEREAAGQLRELLHHAGSTAQLYDSLLRRQKEMRDRQETVAPGVGIQVLAGVPNRPSSHNPILFIFPAFIVFAIGGSWLAVVLEQLDRGLRSEQETSDALGISCIGLVPMLPRKNAIRPYQHLLTEPSSAYAEAIRSAVAALGLAGSTRSSKVILISSSVPGEGKTTLARSVAAYLGVLGRRVLLIDLDFRKGSPLGEFDDTAERAIVDLPLPNRPPAELIRHIAEAGLDYLPMAGYRPDPLAIFACEQMPRLVRQLRERYDCVIIDGPPVLGSVEARLLPSIADKLLFVVKWGSTRREVAQNALSLLRDSGCIDLDRSDPAIAIVAQVDLKRHARYRYGDVGEFLAKHRNYYSGSTEAKPDTGHKDPTVGAHHEQPSTPKVSGD